MTPFPSATAHGILQRLHPLAKCAGALFCFVLLTLTSEKNITFSIVLIVEILSLLLCLGGFRWKQFRAFALICFWIGLSYFILYAISPVRPSIPYANVLLWKWGPLTMSQGSLFLAMSMVLRVIAYLCVSLLFLGTTSLENILRALIQQRWLPYRVGYAVLASLRTIPLLRSELEQMRLAQRLRGVHVSRWHVFSSFRQLALPLLVRAIRRAEQTALSMDARAFGVYPTRTWLHRIHYRCSDVITVLFWIGLHTSLYLALS